MKHLFLPVCMVIIALSSFGQTTTPTATDKKAAAQPPAKTNSAIAVSTAQVIENIDANMVRIDRGSFIMGCNTEKDTGCYYWEKPAHKVSIETFFMCKYPVTQKEWTAIMGDKPWFSKDCADCPVENVSWYDAQTFINKLNQLSGKFYRLPTEAEWEYAARGGNRSRDYKYAGSNNIDVVAWYEANSGKQSHPVGQKLPNELGLYDMSGNVWQWCHDWFNDKYYETSPPDNPLGPGRESYRSCRGGSWWSEAKDCRLANRDRYPPDARDDDVGFRIVKE